MKSLFTDKTQEKRSRPVANEFPRNQKARESAIQMVDNRPEGVAQKKLRVLGDNRPGVNQMKALQVDVHNSEKVKQAVQLQPLSDHCATSRYTAQRVAIQLQYDPEKECSEAEEKKTTDVALVEESEERRSALAESVKDIAQQ